MLGREVQDALYARFAEIAEAFASPRRIAIIEVLSQGERRVETLAEETGQTVANTSRHLQILKRANLVAFRKDGVQVSYRLADPVVLQGYCAIRRLARDRLADVDRLAGDYFAGVDGLAPMEREDLRRRVEAGEAAVVDVRPAEEFSAGHVKGALSIPLVELAARLDELPRDKRIVACCRGPYCVLAAEAVRLLRERGFDAVRLEDGFPEWRDAGLPVEAAGPERAA